MDSQLEVYKLLTEGQLIEKLYSEQQNYFEDLIVVRDQDAFSNRWVLADQLIESFKAKLTQEQILLTDQIRETAYMRSIRLSNSPDLAACISDDFGLIADAAALVIDEPWISGLLECYKNGMLPIK